MNTKQSGMFVVLNSDFLHFRESIFAKFVLCVIFLLMIENIVVFTYVFSIFVDLLVLYYNEL